MGIFKGVSYIRCTSIRFHKKDTMNVILQLSVIHWHIPENFNLQYHSCENLKFLINGIILGNFCNNANWQRMVVGMPA